MILAPNRLDSPRPRFKTRENEGLPAMKRLSAAIVFLALVGCSKAGTGNSSLAPQARFPARSCCVPCLAD
jgi:hypothetical protein